jgi:hypothetical protein
MNFSWATFVLLPVEIFAGCVNFNFATKNTKKTKTPVSTISLVFFVSLVVHKKSL